MMGWASNQFLILSMLNFEELFYDIDVDIEIDNETECEGSSFDDFTYDPIERLAQIKFSPPISMPYSTSSNTDYTDTEMYNDSDLRESIFLRRMNQAKMETGCFNNEIIYKAIPVKQGNQFTAQISNVKLKMKSLSKIDSNLQRRANNRHSLRQQKNNRANIPLFKDKSDDFYIKCEGEVW